MIEIHELKKQFNSQKKNYYEKISNLEDELMNKNSQMKILKKRISQYKSNKNYEEEYKKLQEEK